jgi:hypothetical protein
MILQGAPHSLMPLLPTHNKKAGIAEKKPKKILIT